MRYSVEQLVMAARQTGASDVHLIAGLKPRMRLHGLITEFQGADVLTREDCRSCAEWLTDGRLPGENKNGEFDGAKNIGTVRVRINVFLQQGCYSAALRLLGDGIPELEMLGFPPAVFTIPELKRGLVLVTGETGSGKSTTLASILNRINKTRAGHIITLEDPTEYIYRPELCIINQREVGKDTESFALGLRAALREDPDIILVGEMRDVETMETALTAAETGHLVFATLHTNSAADSVDRIVSAFEGGLQQQIRMQLSTTLQAVISQQLIRRTDGQGRALAYELMMVNPAIRNLIREGKTVQIESALSTSAKIGSISMDNCLVSLAMKRVITPEEAASAARDADYVLRSVGRPVMR